MNNIFYHSSLFSTLPTPLPGSQGSIHFYSIRVSLRAKPQGKTSLFSCVISANAGLISMPPKCRLTAEIQIFYILTAFPSLSLLKSP